MYDVTNRDSFENINSWLEEVAVNTSSNIVMTLVANKIDISDE